ncbi:hypothetical protein ACQ4PT_035631 [Festuca glaucescens]
MEKVEGLLRKLKLSEAEMAGLRIQGQEMVVDEGSKREEAEPMAIIKVLSEKMVSTEGVKQALGPIWCPIRGIRCKKKGENIFMISFLQASGKKKALDSGPWMLNNDLVVVEDFDPNKSVDEYDFKTVPIWIRVLKLPLGRMNRITAEMIGEKVGEWLEADVDEDGFAKGEHLRVKVRIDITVPLMRGMMIQVGDDGKIRWCPFEYEFLPEFCYTCGIIGHDDKSCSVPVERGEEKQFGSWLRAYIPKKQTSNERQIWLGGGGSGSGGRSYGFGCRRDNSGSNSLSWRKEEIIKTGSSTESQNKPDKEVPSPLKKPEKSKMDETKKKLDFPVLAEAQMEQQEAAREVKAMVFPQGDQESIGEDKEGWFSRDANAGEPDALFLALKFFKITNVQTEIFGKLLPYASPS